MKIEHYIDNPNTQAKQFFMKDVPPGMGVYSDTMEVVLVPVEGTMWVGFDDHSIGIIDDDRSPISGILVDLEIVFNLEAV